MVSDNDLVRLMKLAGLKEATDDLNINKPLNIPTGDYGQYQGTPLETDFGVHPVDMTVKASSTKMPFIKSLKTDKKNGTEVKSPAIAGNDPAKTDNNMGHKVEEPKMDNKAPKTNNTGTENKTGHSDSKPFGNTTADKNPSTTVDSKDESKTEPKAESKDEKKDESKKEKANEGMMERLQKLAGIQKG